MKITRIASLFIAAALVVPTGTAFAQEESMEPEASLSPEAQSFADLFPVEIGGVELAGRIEVMSGTSEDFESTPELDAMIEDLGIGLEDVLVGQAMTFDDFFDEEAEGAWIIAFQIPGMDPETGEALMVEMWTAEAPEETVVAEAEVAGRTVTRITVPEEAGAAIDIYASEDTVWFVVASDPELQEEAVSQLP
jgi:hypothetical protein